MLLPFQGSRIMGRYYLHLRDDVDDIMDGEGKECPSLGAVEEAALASAPDI